jgi:hypothetical protein
MTKNFLTIKTRLIKLTFPCVLFFFSSNFAAYSQVKENTNNESRGSSNSFTITINSTHGIQSSASRTKDFKVETYGNMVVDKDSTSIQTNNDGSNGYMKSSEGDAIGQTVGVSGMQRIKFGEGTRYEVKIIPKTDSELCPDPSKDCILPELGTASASSTGSTSTSITVNSTESSFVNTFIRSFSTN